MSRAQAVVLAVLVLALAAVYALGGPGEAARNARLGMAYLAPVSVRILPVEDREGLSQTANVHRYLVRGRVAEGAQLRCWVEAYHDGIRTHDVVELVVPLTRSGVTLTSVHQAIPGDGQWVENQWTLLAGDEAATGSFPFHNAVSTVAGQASGPFDLSQQAATLCWQAYDTEKSGEDLGFAWSPEPTGHPFGMLMAMEYAYVLRVAVTDR